MLFHLCSVRNLQITVSERFSNIQYAPGNSIIYQEVVLGYKIILLFVCFLALGFTD